MFGKCESLEYADLSAAHGLPVIGESAFDSCKGLKRVLLNDGLVTIGKECFKGSGLEEVTIPGSVGRVEDYAFSDTPLTRVHFLDAPKTTSTDVKLPTECSSSDTEEDSLKSELQRVIGKKAFANCKSLRQVVFDPGSAVTEIW